MKLKGIVLITLAFFAPISIFLTDLGVFSLTAIWLFEGRFSDKWKKITASPWISSLLLLMFVYILGLLWGTNHNNAAWLFQKSALLLLLPILYTLDFTQKEVRFSLLPFFLQHHFLQSLL